MGFPKGHRRLGGRTKGVKNKATRDIQAYARSILETSAYRISANKRILRGQAPHLEILLFHYGYGKPHDTLRIDQPRPLVLELLSEAPAHDDGGGNGNSH